ncbi:hypothetical protein CFIMG_001135RAa [Ceratocystis fimbriata CBS 114723]|uniref:Uncharacterized protein n=1 Tax=Ceratocystis fimbriata CBS 114723 TaxID=1035309 RepID=A0A2C5XK50_9PEZI|nr:hypothetical protein CFIMG_001135RAa [Ceratocystis fimbriata CBS 114723]
MFYTPSALARAVMGPLLSKVYPPRQRRKSGAEWRMPWPKTSTKSQPSTSMASKSAETKPGLRYRPTLSACKLNRPTAGCHSKWRNPAAV